GALFSGDSGAGFRVRVSNAFGSVLSDPAIVSITSGFTITWTGVTGNGDWFTAGNWSPEIVPTVNDTVNVNATLNIPSGADFGILNFSGGAIYGGFASTGTINWSGGILY